MSGPIDVSGPRKTPPQPESIVGHTDTASRSALSGLLLDGGKQPINRFGWREIEAQARLDELEFGQHRIAVRIGQQVHPRVAHRLWCGNEGAVGEIEFGTGGNGRFGAIRQRALLVEPEPGCPAERVRETPG